MLKISKSKTQQLIITNPHSCVLLLFRYACLVAEPATNDPDSPKQLVGVIDVTVLRDQNVLQHLPAEAEEYLYISGIAVSKTFR